MDRDAQLEQMQTRWLRFLHAETAECPTTADLLVTIYQEGLADGLIETARLSALLNKAAWAIDIAVDRLSEDGCRCVTDEPQSCALCACERWLETTT